MISAECRVQVAAALRRASTLCSLSLAFRYEHLPLGVTLEVGLADKFGQLQHDGCVTFCVCVGGAKRIEVCTHRAVFGCTQRQQIALFELISTRNTRSVGAKKLSAFTILVEIERRLAALRLTCVCDATRNIDINIVCD